MAVLSVLGRFAKLGFWVGLSAGALLAEACSNGLKVKAHDAASEVPAADAPGFQLRLDGAVKADANVPGADGGAVDADHSPTDAGQTDLWDIICE